MKRWAAVIGFAVAAALPMLCWMPRSSDGQRIEMKKDASPAGPVKASPKVEPLEPSPEQAEQIDKLIEQLGAPTMSQRDRAMSELVRFGAYAINQVRKGMEHDDDEIVHRCRLLDEMLGQGQAELFLAARRLGMTIQELEERLRAADPDALLELLESRATAGLTPLWAVVLRQLAPRTNRYTAARVCRAVEGPEGYGEALVRATTALADGPVNGHAKGLLDLVRLVPPGSAHQAAFVLAGAGSFADPAYGGQGPESAYLTACALRGTWQGKECLAALTPQAEDPTLAEDKFPQAQALRVSVVFALAPSCTEAELKASAFPPFGGLSPRGRIAYLEMLARSRLSTHLEQALTAALAGDGGEAGVAAAARAYAAGAPAADVIDVFEALPLSAQLAVLDAWWLAPRDLNVFQPFFCGLTRGDNPALRSRAARLLSGCRAPSSTLALVQSALKHDDTAPHMLEALRGMADLLPKAAPAEFKQLIARVDTPDLRVRPFLHEVLAASGDTTAENTLKARYHRELTRPETTLAVRVLARNPTTPAGAWSAGAVASSRAARMPLEELLRQHFTLSDFVLLRRLLAIKDADGFKLLEEIAADVDDASRLDAAIALVVCGRDGPLVDDWLKRARGEIPDPHAASLAVAVAYSATSTGVQFRRDVLKMGFTSPQFHALLSAVLAGRGGEITLDDLLPLMLERVENLGRFGPLDMLVEKPLPSAGARVFFNAMIFDNQDGAAVWADPGRTMTLLRSEVDVLALLYGETPKPVPRSPSQTLMTALLGDPARARAILEGVTPSRDGRDFETLAFARTLLGLPGAGRSLDAFTLAGTSPVVEAVLLERRAQGGDVNALRRLLDAVGYENQAMSSATGASYVLRSRWGNPEVARSGAVDPAFFPPYGRRFFPQHLVTEKFGEVIEGDWRDWWAARRCLCVFDPARKLYVMEKLP